MAEPIVTERSVFEAADRLRARGERVSNRTVKKELGGGSLQDICPLLRLWCGQRQAGSPV